MNTHRLLLFLWLFCPLYCFSQQIITIQGHIIDAETNEPLELAAVEIPAQHIGVYTNQKGEFLITVPENNGEEVVTVSFIGYVQKDVSLADLDSSGTHTIALYPLPILLNDVVVKPRKMVTKKVGVTTSKHWRYQIANLFGGQGGQYLPNTQKREGFIKSVHFYILDIGHPETPFRVRIYEFNTETNQPGNDLLLENVMAAGQGRQGWVHVDVSEQAIPFPIGGVVVAMERIYSGEQYYYDHILDSHPELGPQKFYGVAIGTVYKQKQASFWVRRGLGHPWSLMDDYFHGYINLMIYAEVEFPKDEK
jgi:hypothetical protein